MITRFSRMASFLAVILSISASAARADEFSFSYTFGGGPTSYGAGSTVTGTFDGTLLTPGGNLIEDITGASVIFEGVSLGPVSSYGFDGGPVGAAVVSVDGTQNSFDFVNGGPGSLFESGSVGSFSAIYIIN